MISTLNPDVPPTFAPPKPVSRKFRPTAFFIRRFSSKNAENQGSRKLVLTDAETGLAGLPYDILRLILVLVGPLTTYWLTQVSQKYRGLWQDESLWKELAHKAISSAQVLVFDSFEDAASRSIWDIRRALVRSDLLYRSWNSTTATRSSPIRHKEKRLYTGFLDSLTITPSVDNLTVMPCKTDFLDQAKLVVGPVTDSRFLDLPGDFSIHPHNRTGTHFVTVNSFQRIAAPELRTYSVHLSPLSFKDKEGSLEQYVTHIMRVQALPQNHNLVHQVLDINNKRTFTLYARESDYSSERVLKLFVTNWQKDGDIALNTGLIRENANVAARISLNQDGSEVTIYKYNSRSWAHVTFSVSQLCKVKNPSSIRENFSPDINCLPPETPIFNAPLKTCFGQEAPVMEPILYRYWSLPFPQQISTPAPQVHSHIQLSVSLDFSRSRYWSLSQFYTDSQGPGLRSVLVLPNLYVKKSGMALLSVSFSHVAWVESGTTETVVSPKGNVSGKTYRRLRLAAFPPPGSVAVKFEPMTLEIPNSCLAAVRSIYLEPALASVFVLCKGNRLHKFSFA